MSHLDISIKSADKYLTTDKKIEEFLNSSIVIEQKVDGIKLTVLKVADEGNLDDYIFSYKGNILYSTEFGYLSDEDVKKESIGVSQFKFIFDHFKKLKKNDIPVGTELFIEFLMSKPTLSSNYTDKHRMVLIGYSESEYSIIFGKLSTNNSGMSTELRKEYAKSLSIDIPNLVFNGVLSVAFPGESISSIKKHFLSIPSVYGGLEEGVVMSYNGIILKWQQDYQNDQELRRAIKASYKEDEPKDEELYWENMKKEVSNIVDSMSINSRKLPDLMEELCIIIRNLNVQFTHSKKTMVNIKDDIQLTSKLQIIKKMDGNNNALVIGKFRVLTTDGHVKLINKALEEYDDVVICLVTSKDTAGSKDLRARMIQETFPLVKVIHSSNANLIRVLQKSPMNINVILAGSDRVESYRSQLYNALGIEVKELQRDDSDISASKVIENIEDQSFFTNSTPEAIHPYYDSLKDMYGKHEQGVLERG